MVGMVLVGGLGVMAGVALVVVWAVVVAAGRRVPEVGRGRVTRVGGMNRVGG
jgi:hypothetical protein